jgi:hypothetical protein
MKLAFLIWSLALGHCLAGPFFRLQQGVVASQSSAPAYSYPSSVVAAFTSIGSGTFSDGAAIDTLTAIAGSGTVTQGTAANRPAYIATGGPSSQPCWRFDGTDRLKSANMTISQPFTLAVICKRTGSTSSAHRSPMGADGTFVGLTSRIAASSPNPMALYAGTDVAPSANIAIDTWAIVVGVFNGSSSKIFVNGASAVTGNPGTSGTTSSGYSIGSWFTEPWVGDICAAAVFNAALSDSDVSALRTEWNRLYSIY